MGRDRIGFSLFEHLAINHKYGHDRRHFPDGFLIQNTQNRDAKATQLKLDEIIRAVSGARNELMNLEKLSDEDLTKLEKQFTRVRERAERNIGSDGCAPVGESKRGPDEL